MNSFWLDIQDAIKGLRRRPLRSFLSSVGIGIGVTALVTMLSISEGAKEKALQKIRSLGTNTLRIEAVPRGDGRAQSKINLSQGLLLSDGYRIASWLGRRGQVGFYIKQDSVPVRVGNKTVLATVLGVSDGWFKAERLKTDGGRILSANDINLSKTFSVVGGSLAKDLQLSPDSNNLPVQIGPMATTLIGSLKMRGRLLTEGTGLSSLDFDNTVYLPITASPFKKTVADRSIIDGMVIALEGNHGKEVLGVAEQIERILVREHRDVHDFNIVVPLTLLKEVKENQRVFAIIMGIIAGLSLVVGGIGVMNVMLANIAEQTREIGLRMAVGASRSRIISLYLWNSVVLTLFGSFWGIVTGIGLALIVQSFAGWEVVFSSFSLIVAPLSAIFTGIIFGLHPAMRAAALDPARALRDS